MNALALLPAYLAEFPAHNKFKLAHKFAVVLPLLNE